jgi:hypothetical protein
MIDPETARLLSAFAARDEKYQWSYHYTIAEMLKLIPTRSAPDTSKD